MGKATFLRPMLLVAALALLAAPTALGAKPEIFHEQVAETIEDIDLCGITVDLEVTGTFTDRVYFDQDGNFVRFSSTASIMQTFTDADGDSVIVQNAGVFEDMEPIVDEEAGTITFVFSFKGLPEKIQTAQGPVLLRDAGFITFADTIDLETGEFLGTEVVVNRGPHPEADSDFTLFCEVITEALG
jgi:hypothetical protein